MLLPYITPTQKIYQYVCLASAYLFKVDMIMLISYIFSNEKRLIHTFILVLF